MEGNIIRKTKGAKLGHKEGKHHKDNQRGHKEGKHLKDNQKGHKEGKHHKENQRDTRKVNIIRTTKGAQGR